VLAESERSLDPDDQKRASVLGPLLYQENHQHLTASAETLTAEVGGAAPATTTTAFLNSLEDHPDRIARHDRRLGGGAAGPRWPGAQAGHQGDRREGAHRIPGTFCVYDTRTTVGAPQRFEIR
jgi:hypothetical protein